jgi:hypothetical protein
MLYRSALVIGLATAYRYSKRQVELICCDASFKSRRLELTACLPILLFSHRSELHDALATHLPQVPEQVLGPALGTLAAAACILLSVSFRRPQSFRLAGPDARGISSQLLVRHPDPPPLRLQLL